MTRTERMVMLAWQRGRLAFSTTATLPSDSTPQAATTALTRLVEMATRTDARAASLPALLAQAWRRPSWARPSADWSCIRRSRSGSYRTTRWRCLQRRSRRERDPNALMVLDSQIAEAPVSDPTFVKDRLPTSERHILGVSKRYQPAASDDDDPSTQYPAVAIGHHVRRRRWRARGVVRPSRRCVSDNEEIYLVNDPRRQSFADATSR